MSKTKLAMALALLACLAAPVSAQAAQSSALPAKVVFTEDEGGFEDHEDGDHNDDGDREDQDDEDFGSSDDFGPLPVPPVVIAPHDVHGIKPGDHRQYDLSPVDKNFKIDGVNPNEKQPIRVDQVQASPKTPADAFAEASYIGLGALGVGAVALGAVSGVRAYRLRKSGKNDYFYES